MFRAWDGKEMIEYEMNTSYANYEELTLLQYTGLKDKNDVRRCEGDIIKKISSDYEGNIRKETIFQIKFGMFEMDIDTSDGEYGSVPYGFIGFYIQYTNGHIHELDKLECSRFCSYQLLGNIYENPELIEV